MERFRYFIFETMFTINLLFIISYLINVISLEIIFGSRCVISFESLHLNICSLFVHASYNI